jgi:uncharacterized repeat protein (TIGR03803 family)
MQSKRLCGAAKAVSTIFLAFVLASAITAESTRAQTFTVLHNFTGSPDGEGPFGNLVQDSVGSLYGTTDLGGTSNYGTVFKVDRNGTETVLHSFTGESSQGANPYAGVILDAKGNLYGVTYAGGGTGCGGNGCGTVFKLSKSGKETVLHRFVGGTTDGCHPYGGLVRDKPGNLYGTTLECGSANLGTVFKLDTAFTETVLHSFAGGTADGAYPYLTSLVTDVKGDIYGVTYEGGVSSEGVMFRLNKRGTLTVLHSFTGGLTDGCNPVGTPAVDGNGNFYGAAYSCGASGEGIVWRISKNGAETVLHNFVGSPIDGAYPYAGVVLDRKGNLYGDTSAGGAPGFGTVYELSKEGTVTLLHNFAGPDGELPLGGLVRDAEGTLYSTAVRAGSGCCGTVWKLTP